MDFSPYQSEEPSHSRTAIPGFPASPTTPAGRTPSVASSQPPRYSPAPSAAPIPTAISYDGSVPTSSNYDQPSSSYGQPASNYGPPTEDPNAMPVNQYETNLPIRLDWECVIAYLALPPVGSAALLIFETKNDFVRFHAWQAALFFSPLFLLYIILSISTVISYIILAVYIISALYLSYRVFRDSSTLVRLELPVIGRLASDWVDAE
ncbi:uncharacterized protein V1518DRAFT_409519 [Limtongia smithiae]|uniref:uncharacterized protein n=1 Tax=Limtongia smithiae TaxID=1125753 RepID=UPI0034CD2856